MWIALSDGATTLAAWQQHRRVAKPQPVRGQGDHGGGGPGRRAIHRVLARPVNADVGWLVGPSWAAPPSVAGVAVRRIQRMPAALNVVVIGSAASVNRIQISPQTP